MGHLFSIGHGNKDIELFIQELKSFDIGFLIDIRTTPFSKWNPKFNQDMLKFLLTEQRIKYIYMGEELGGLPKDASCYTNGKVDYDILKTKDFFQKGLERLLVADKKELNVAVMCSESNPAECHRTKLIGIELQKKGINLRHIVGIDKEKNQTQVINELTNGNGLITLFGEESFTSRKQYITGNQSLQQVRTWVAPILMLMNNFLNNNK
ncbi:hypothetical protein Barb7_01479 [Bacteroidales bacterium Barb7]|nr:hypothetical protein Barb7_01479 [Bacteroidales bacterium Barb7]